MSDSGPPARVRLARAEQCVRLGALLRGIRAAVARQDARLAGLARPGITPLAVTRQHAQLLLAGAEAFVFDGRARGPGGSLTVAERYRLGVLAHEAGEAGVTLPGRLLASRGLSELDLQLLLLVAAPVLDASFGTIYGYVGDLRSCLACTPYVAIEVLACDAADETDVLTAAGPYGTLRAHGWVHATPVERSTTVTLRPADGVVELLSGAPVDDGLLGRPRDLSGAAHAPSPVVARMAAALADGRLDVVGVWGRDGAGSADVVAALAGGRDIVPAGAGDLAAALQRAVLTGGVCVVEVPSDPDRAEQIAACVARAAAPVVLVSEEPLRWPGLIRTRRYAEVSLPPPGFAERRASWSAAFPGLDTAGVDDLAARFRLGTDEIAAVARMDGASASWSANEDRPTLAALAGLVSRRRSSRLAATRAPRRGRELLVLPDTQMAQVLEVAEAARAWPRVAEVWRLDRFGNPGITALFAGDPGTGKTLAAEVIASEVGLDLMEVDLSRLVSKWLGETEKHLDAVFGEAESSHCVLFFDEADSLFGQRGEVTRGTDRYANLEVGYLLQRLERYQGLVILASNLRANLDPAFTRRFHHVVHFPKPAPEQRRRMWEIALGPPLRLAEPVDLDVLAGLELTGAGIAAIVRGASLAAAARPCPGGPAPVTLAELVAAAQKQFQREARLLPREQLAGYAGLL